MTDFKKKYSLDHRKKEAKRILTKYPNRIPIIVNIPKNSGIPELDKKKYLIPGDMTLGQFMYVLRKRISLRPETALFLYVGNTLAPTSEIVAQIYENHKDLDNFLYISVLTESTFGDAFLQKGGNEKLSLAM
jgi:GABA(A) receptor-associated protein